ncbi:MAG: CDP-glycerol glycerophosphotransferase family protein [Desulfovibrio sp.]|nr:CDP-glycerol glycerophosphotransferase family protein [Desulfovibrio sp.]
MQSIKELLEAISRVQTYVLRRVAAKLRDGKTLNVYFFVSQKQFWSMQSVYDALAAYDCFRLYIVPFPTSFHTHGERKRNYADLCEFHEKKGATIVRVCDCAGNLLIQPEELEADLVLYEQHWMINYHPSYTLWEMCVMALCVCMPYGIMIANIPEDQFNENAHNLAWRNFAETPMHLKLSRKYAANKGVNTVVSGYPKLDAYARPVEKNYWKTDSPRIKRIVWAPHYSIRTDDAINCSTFHMYWMQFMELVKNSGDKLEMVLKPHPALKSRCLKVGFPEEIFDRYMSEWDSLPNASVVTDGDYVDLFTTSDALILDSLSFISEYLVTGKPMCFLSKFPDFSKLSGIFNDYGKMVISLVDVAYNFNDAATFINNVCKGTAGVSSEREYFTDSMLKVNFGHVGEFIANHILEQLRAV